MALSTAGLTGPDDLTVRGGGAANFAPGGGGSRAPGWGVGNPLVMAMGGLQQASERFGEAWDNAAITKAQLDLRSAYTDRYLNPETGEFKTRRGMAAQGMYDDGRQFFSDLETDIKKNLSPRQRKMFTPVAANEMRGYAHQIASHEGSEILNYYKQENEVQIKAAIDLAVADPMNPDTLPAAFGTLKNLYDARGTYEGWSQEYTALQLKEAQGSVITSMADVVSIERPTLGLGLLKANREFVDPVKYARAVHILENKVEAAAARAERVARREASVILSQVDNEVHYAVEKGDFTHLESMRQNLLRLGQTAEASKVGNLIEVYQIAKPGMDAIHELPIAQQREALEKAFSAIYRRDNAALVDKVKTASIADLHKREQAFIKDPAGHVADDPFLQEQGLSSEERINRSYALQNIAGQGVAFKRSPLPKGVADKINAEYYQAEPAQQAAMIMRYGQEYGAYAGDVFDQAKMPDFSVAISAIADKLTPSIVTGLVTASSIPSDKLPPLNESTKVDLQGSKFLRTAQDVANTMTASRGQREFTVSIYKSFEHYVRAGGKIGDIENNFFAINDGNMKILAPVAMNMPGLEETISRKTYELTNEAVEIKNPVERSTWLNIYRNGQWVFDGGSGFALIDAATGLNALDSKGKPVRIGIDDVVSLNPAIAQEDE